MANTLCTGQNQDGTPCTNAALPKSHHCQEHTLRALVAASRTTHEERLAQMAASTPLSEETLEATIADFRRALDALPKTSERRRLLRAVFGCEPGEERESLDDLFSALKKTYQRIAAAAAAGKLEDPNDPQEAIRKGYASDDLLTLYVVTFALLFGPNRSRTAPTSRAKLPRPSPLPEYLEFPSDLIQKGAVEGFSLLSHWAPLTGFWQGYAPSARPNGGFSLLMGFRTDPGAAMWEFLLARGEATIKAHYALWTRLYEQTGGKPGQYAVIDIRQFLADLGYKRHHKGGYRREQKQDAMRLLEALTTVEIAVDYTPPGNGMQRRLRGPLWQRGFVAEEQDRYGDLFGQAREGDPALWDPVGFTFEPGPWFRDPIWRKHNRYLGLIGAGLLRLQTDQDQVAIRIGGYLGTLARMGHYQLRRLRMETLLHRIGMADRYPKYPQKLQEVVESGLDKVVGVNILASWRYTDEDPTEPDMDDPTALAALADANVSPWRKRVIEVVWPEALTRQTARLESAQTKARAKARAKAKLPAHEEGGRPHP